MKKTSMILTLCIIIAVLICMVPIPQVLKDGGTVYLRPIVPTYEIYLYNAEWSDGQTMKGVAIVLFGIDIYENTYYVGEYPTP